MVAAQRRLGDRRQWIDRQPQRVGHETGKRAEGCDRPDRLLHPHGEFRIREAADQDEKIGRHPQADRKMRDQDVVNRAERKFGLAHDGHRDTAAFAVRQRRTCCDKRQGCRSQTDLSALPHQSGAFHMIFLFDVQGWVRHVGQTGHFASSRRRINRLMLMPSPTIRLRLAIKVQIH